MNRTKKLIIGSRSSDLALWQANYVKKEIEKKNKNIKIEIKLIKTRGDKIQDVALHKIGSKSLFTKELEIALLKGSIDIAIHSLKDIQTEIPKGLQLAAVTKRASSEDVLIARKKNMTIEKLPEGAIVATGSLRRRSQLKHLRPDIKVEELRGNLPTRIKKFENSDWDAIILAKAGIERLKMKKYISSVIDFHQMLPAAGQGALGIEIAEKNIFAKEIIMALNDETTFIETTAERALLKALEGGCQVPIGVLAQLKKNGLYLDALVGSIDGMVTFRKRIRGSKKNPIELGKKLAAMLKRAGATEILNEIYGTKK